MSPRLSVVLGEFCCVLRLGLRSVLAERGCRIVAEGARHDALRAAVAGGVDAVLLDLDAPGCIDEARWLLAQRPGVRVIGCSAARPAMLVFYGDVADERALDPGELVAAMSAS